MLAWIRTRTTKESPIQQGKLSTTHLIVQIAQRIVPSLIRSFLEGFKQFGTLLLTDVRSSCWTPSRGSSRIFKIRQKRQSRALVFRRTADTLRLGSAAIHLPFAFGIYTNSPWSQNSLDTNTPSIAW